MAAIALFVSACSGSSPRVFEDSASMTTVPPPTTTSTSTTTTVPACAQASIPAGNVTSLATPDSPNLGYADSPGGPTVGHVKEAWGGPSTRPVIADANGWIEIPLDTRPNNSAGWLPLSEVTLSTTSYYIVVSICQRSLTLYEGGTPVYSAPVGVGEPQWPTPVGNTFVDSIVATPRFQEYIYGPHVFILGVHSNVFTDFDGGDGTVGIHGYPSDPGSTDGVRSSHGCVRASPTTINTLLAVPVGTPVDIIA